MKIKDLQKNFLDKGTFRGEMFLLPPDITLDFVHECHKKNVEILGIDAFFIKGDAIQPILEHSIDFSSSYYRQKGENIFEDALLFLQDRMHLDIYFEIIVKLP
ncbi:MAG: hypothetical protein KC419_08675 [Anaerolineales bacterium]|nr:hypothetical protein [Anaerolineales bacterium]MCA9928538.1 hypothetical protein [Anaerolineales bacterium]